MVKGDGVGLGEGVAGLDLGKGVLEGVGLGDGVGEPLAEGFGLGLAAAVGADVTMAAITGVAVAAGEESEKVSSDDGVGVAITADEPLPQAAATRTIIAPSVRAMSEEHTSDPAQLDSSWNMRVGSPRSLPLGEGLIDHRVVAAAGRLRGDRGHDPVGAGAEQNARARHASIRTTSGAGSCDSGGPALRDRSAPA